MLMRFPQISRFFSATFFLSLMGTLLGLNIYLASNQPVPPLLQEVGVLKEPQLGRSHEQLAQAYWQQGNLVDATRELQIAGDVLGTTTYQAQIDKWQAERYQKEAALAFWKIMTERYPNYRDAFLWAGATSFELGRTEEARKYLTQAISLDQYLEFPKLLLSKLE